MSFFEQEVRGSLIGAPLTDLHVYIQQVGHDYDADNELDDSDTDSTHNDFDMPVTIPPPYCDNDLTITRLTKHTSLTMTKHTSLTVTIHTSLTMTRLHHYTKVTKHTSLTMTRLHLLHDSDKTHLSDNDQTHTSDSDHTHISNNDQTPPLHDSDETHLSDDDLTHLSDDDLTHISDSDHFSFTSVKLGAPFTYPLLLTNSLASN